jgi:NADH:ubiquinone oxidoreductase subunit 2 (subunit N)
METGLLHLHSSLPYIFLPLLLISLVIFWIKRGKKAEFGKNDKRLALFTLILSHLQLVIGLLLYFIGPKGFDYLSQEGFMKNSIARFYAVEHISVMILGIVLITIGYSGAKRRTESSAKFRHLALFYSLGAVLILSRIPWEAWLS